MKTFTGKKSGGDQTEALQGWLDDIAGDIGYLDSDTFDHQELIIRSGTELVGNGKSRSILRNIGEHGLHNGAMVFDGIRLDKDITLRGIGFHGLPERLMGPYSDFVTFIGVEGLTIRDCSFAHRQLDGIVTANNFNMRICDNEFYDLGTKTLPEHPGTGKFVGGTCIFSYRPSFRSWVTGNYIHDCIGGGGIWLPVSGDPGEESEFYIVTGNTLINLVEFGIRGAPRGSKVDGNIISRIRNADLDGHGAVMAGHSWSFSNNDISDCDCAGVQLYNVADVSVCGNGIRDNNRLGLGYPAIRLTSWSPQAIPGSRAPHDSCIRGNLGNGGIDQLDMGGGPMSDLEIGDNHWQQHTGAHQ